MGDAMASVLSACLRDTVLRAGVSLPCFGI